MGEKIGAVKELLSYLIEQIESEEKCSIEIGNSKSGIVKVYFNPDEPEKARQKLDFAINLLLEKRAMVLENKEVKQ